MSSSTLDESAAGPRRFFPAYGPLEALLGMVLFVTILETVTPTVVDVAGSILPDLPAATVRLGLALFVWFVVGVTVLDQGRRQLAALDIGSHPMVPRTDRAAPSGRRALVCVAILLAGGLVATATYEVALRGVVSLIELVAYQDVSAFGAVRTLLMVVFFVSYGAATWALDRLVIGSIRAIIYD